MASFPTNNVHRRDRRKLGRGQSSPSTSVATSVAPSGSTTIVTFSRPVNVSGPLPMTVATRTFVSQTVDSPTQVTVTWSGTVATHAYSLPSNPATVSNYQGGAIVGAAGTFP